MKVMVTGAAGFIGYHVAKRLHSLGHEVIGIDSFNDYYDPGLKNDRADDLPIDVINCDLCNEWQLDTWFSQHTPDAVVHLAAYAGVRSSLENPQLYINNNITGTQNLIHQCERTKVKKVVYASTSSVNTGPVPFKEDNPGPAKHPYAMTKIANESQFNYSRIPQTVGLRFFTVYGPWGRPDMALFKFTDKIVRGEKISVYNNGDMTRDFTYIDDIVNGIIIALLSDKPGRNEIYNIGYGEQVQLMDFVREIEKNLGREAKIRHRPMHPADNKDTWSDTSKLQALGYKPTVQMREGVARFIEWYKNYYRIN